MKKVLLAIFALISLNVFSQINIKEGSFRKIEGYVMLDKSEHLDDNDNPMALIKITTENISAEERAKFTYKGNIETYFDVQQHEVGQTYLYISAKPATFIEIIHPDYGKTEYTFPFDLCDYCGYEMVVQYVPLVPIVTQESSKPKKTYLIVKSDQTDARIYIDDELVNTHEASKTVDFGSTHTYKIECNLYHTESGSVTINDRTEINKKLRPAFGYINISTSPEQGAKAFVDGDYIGLTPITTDKIRSGSHTVMVMKDMYKMKEQSYNVTDGQTTNVTLNMDANFVTITLTVDIDADIYVDEEFKGKGKWTGRLSDGAHIFEARKENHKTSVKTVNLVLGKNETIALDAPTPINGDIDINTTPMGATIYIDGKNYGETPNYIFDILIGKHELKLTKQGCAELKKTIVVKEGETLTINEILQAGKEITITTDQSGDKIYVDGNYIGTSPITTTLSYGSHEIKAERNGKTVSKTVNVAQNEVSNVELKFNEENGHEYVDLGLSVKWATCNVGANKPEDYGNYYAWGETSTKSDYTVSNCQTDRLSISQLQSQGYIDSEGNLTSQYDAATANWGGKWRLPTKTEMQELIDKCTWTWTKQNGVKGYKVTGPNGNSIFLPAAGDRGWSSLHDAGSRGNYWSSTPYEDNDYYADYLSFNRNLHYVGDNFRSYGRSVRSILE